MFGEGCQYTFDLFFVDSAKASHRLAELLHFFGRKKLKDFRSLLLAD
jgi:hypothetical protein